MIEFTSLNPYQTLEQVTASSPQELVEALRAIKTPIKIVGMTTYGTRQVAYIIGDIRKPQKKTKESK